MFFNAPSLSVARIASCSAAILFLLKGGFLLVYFFLLLASFSAMTKIGCNTMCTAIGFFCHHLFLERLNVLNLIFVHMV